MNWDLRISWTNLIKLQSAVWTNQIAEFDTLTGSWATVGRVEFWIFTWNMEVQIKADLIQQVGLRVTPGRARGAAGPGSASAACCVIDCSLLSFIGREGEQTGNTGFWVSSSPVSGTLLPPDGAQTEQTNILKPFRLFFELWTGGEPLCSSGTPENHVQTGWNRSLWIRTRIKI